MTDMHVQEILRIARTKEATVKYPKAPCEKCGNTSFKEVMIFDVCTLCWALRW